MQINVTMKSATGLFVISAKFVATRPSTEEMNYSKPYREGRGGGSTCNRYTSEK